MSQISNGQMDKMDKKAYHESVVKRARNILKIRAEFNDHTKG